VKYSFYPLSTFSNFISLSLIVLKVPFNLNQFFAGQRSQFFCTDLIDLLVVHASLLKLEFCAGRILEQQVVGLLFH